MLRAQSFRRWVVAFGIAGALSGAVVAHAQDDPDPARPGTGGCECTISGAGLYTCGSPALCVSGIWKCNAVCQ